MLIRSDVDPNSVQLSWRNKEDIVTADSRVTIITSSVNNTLNASSITTTITFDPLFEDDEGSYTCFASVNELLLLECIQLRNFQSKHVIINMCMHTYMTAAITINRLMKFFTSTYILCIATAVTTLL